MTDRAYADALLDAMRMLVSAFTRTGKVPPRVKEETSRRVREGTLPPSLVGHPSMTVGCPACQTLVPWATWPEHVLTHGDPS